MMNADDAPLLEARGLSKSFQRGGRDLVAVHDVGFTLETGRTLALVGPSGSGKSTLARLVTRLIPADNGELLFKGRDFLKLNGAELRRERRDIQMVFQDPLAAFNPHATVSRVIEDPLRIHAMVSPRERAAAVDRLLERVGLPANLRQRPIHQISGGQRQRVAIARAIATRPKLIVLDEALSALDMGVRAQIVDLLTGLQKTDGIAYLFISHDLALVESMAHQVAILDGGRIVEQGNAADVISNPASSMGQALVRAVPRLFGDLKKE